MLPAVFDFLNGPARDLQRALGIVPAPLMDLCARAITASL